jgi:hypothetical protein
MQGFVVLVIEHIYIAIQIARVADPDPHGYELFLEAGSRAVSVLD